MAVNASELYVDPEERARWRTRLEQERIVRDFEVQFHQSDGTVIWARDTARAVRDVDGRVLYFEGSVEDIAVRKRAEETLKQRNHELATLFEATTAISSNLSLGTVLQTVAEQMVSALGSTGCALSIWHRERDTVETLAEHNTLKPENNDPPGTNYALSDYPATRQVLETGQPMLIQHDDPTGDQAELAWMASKM